MYDPLDPGNIHWFPPVAPPAALVWPSGPIVFDTGANTNWANFDWASVPILMEVDAADILGWTAENDSYRANGGRMEIHLE